MKLIYKGQFDGNPSSLPHGEHKEGAIKFKEPDNPKKLAIIANGIALGLTVVCFIIFSLRSSFLNFSFLGVIASLIILFPHELLHAICFKDTVYLYTNLKQGMLFVVGPEIMTRNRFVFMSLLPNIIFGFIPFILFLIHPQWTFLGTLGAISIGSGAGDYMNVYNALTQMPKNALTYLYQFNSYWYTPKEELN